MLFGDSFITRHLFPSLATRVLCRPMPFADTSLMDFVRAIFMVAYLDFRSMPFADSPVYCSLCAIFMVAFFDFDLRSMLDADSSFLDKAGAPRTTAMFALCPMLVTDSSVDDIVGASLMTASFALCPMLVTHSSVDGFVGATITTAKFFRCPMLITHSSPDGYIATSSCGAYLATRFFAGAFSTSSSDVFFSWHLDNNNCGRISKQSMTPV